MFDTASTDTLCMLAGGVALGAILCTRSRPAAPYGPTECSARKSAVEPVSARAADATPADGLDFSFWEQGDLSSGFEEQMKAAGPAKDGHMSDKVKQAMRDVQPKVMELNRPKIGVEPLIAGRGHSDAAAKPAVSGEYMFYMSDAMSQQLLDQEASGQ